jgi:hypothetical protein
LLRHSAPPAGAALPGLKISANQSLFGFPAPAVAAFPFQGQDAAIELVDARSKSGAGSVSLIDSKQPATATAGSCAGFCSSDASVHRNGFMLDVEALTLGTPPRLPCGGCPLVPGSEYFYLLGD